MIPAGYTQIEYVQSNGTGSFFNTGIKPSANTRVVFDGYVVSGDTALYGSRYANADNRYAVQFIGTEVYRIGYVTSESLVSNSYVKGVRHIFDQRDGQLYIDDTLVATISLTANFPNAQNIYAVGCLNTKGNATNLGVVRMYSMQIYQNDVLVRDYLPVQDASGTIGIYDQVSQGFVANGGSGVVVGGEPIVVRTMTGIEITTPPAKVEYLYGEALDTTGMVVTALFSDDTSEVVTEYTVSGYDKNVTGQQRIDVAYNGFITHFNVTVTRLSFSVTFKNWDDSVIDTQTVFGGEAADTPADPARTGYRFVGWDKTFSNITEDTVITALYVQLFTVTFIDGYDNTIIDTQVVDAGSAAIAPDIPVHTYYAFQRWDIPFDNITADTTITAVYQEMEKYTVIFKNWDDSILKTEVLYRGEDATAPEIQDRTGYDFTGWDNDFSNIAANTTITAQYTKKTYTVRFLDWNGQVISSQNIPYLDGAEKPADPVRNGYTFTGWDKSFAEIIENTDITAQYEIAIVVESVQVKTMPSKTVYVLGESFDKAGMVIAKKYSNETEEVTDDYTLSGFSSTTAGEKVITVKCEGMSTTFTVTVRNVRREYIGSPTLEDVVAELNIDTGILTVSGTGNMKDFTSGSPIMSYYKNNSKKVIVEEGITNIGSFAFYGYSNLVEITIPKSITVIGRNICGKCTSLVKVNYNAIKCECGYQDENGYYIPFKETAITEFTFGDKVEKIPAGLLWLCSSLEQITIPTSVKTIGDYAFYNTKIELFF